MRNKIKAAMSRYFHQLPGEPNGPAPPFDDDPLPCELAPGEDDELPPFSVVPVEPGDVDPLGDGDVVLNADPEDVGDGEGEPPSLGDGDWFGDGDDVGVDTGVGLDRGVCLGVGVGLGGGVGDPWIAMTAGTLVAFALWPLSDCVASTRAR
jgi:hypothetical protein